MDSPRSTLKSPLPGHSTEMEPIPSEPPTTPVDHQVRPSRHSKYYFDSEMAIFLVEDKLFKVHRHFLIRESDVFQWMFACPPRQDGPEGDSDDRPIHLPDVRCREFERLLDFFYAGMFRPQDCLAAESPLFREATGQAYLEQWTDVLAIATRFDFLRVRKYAIDMIDASGTPLDPIEKIWLSDKHDIPQWLAPAFESLCQRLYPLEIAEAERIGLRNATLLARAREAVREQYNERTSQPISARPSRRPATPVPTSPDLRYNTSMVAQAVNEVLFPQPPKTGPYMH